MTRAGHGGLLRNDRRLRGPEPLAPQRPAVHPVPAGQAIPDVFKTGMHPAGGGQHQQPPRPGEGDVVLAGVIEVRDAVGRLEGGPAAVGPELPAHRVHVGVVIVKRARDHHVPLPSLGLVNGRNGERPASVGSAAASGTGRCAVHGYASPLQGIQVADGRSSLYRVQQQGRLIVFGNDPLAFQELHQLRQLPALGSSITTTVHGDDRRILPIRAGVVGSDGLGVAKGPPTRIGIGPVARRPPSTGRRNPRCRDDFGS